jgi:hypothetical protein
MLQCDCHSLGDGRSRPEGKGVRRRGGGHDNKRHGAQHEQYAYVYVYYRCHHPKWMMMMGWRRHGFS